MNDFTVGELSLTRLPPRSTRKKGASGAVIFFNEFMNDIRIEDFTRLTMAIGDFTKDFAEFWKMFGPTSGETPFSFDYTLTRTHNTKQAHTSRSSPLRRTLFKKSSIGMFTRRTFAINLDRAFPKSINSEVSTASSLRY